MAAEIECIACDGSGLGAERKTCPDCNGSGFFLLEECPRKFIGNSMTEEINLASYAQKGNLPEAGGMLDQPAWFVDLWGVLDQDQHRIEAEIRKRR